MDRQRWDRLKPPALARDAAGRAKFLVMAYAVDPELRQEIEVPRRADAEAAEGFLAEPFAPAPAAARLPPRRHRRLRGSDAGARALPYAALRHDPSRSLAPVFAAWLALSPTPPAPARIVDVAAGEQDGTAIGAAAGDGLGDRHAIGSGDVTGDGIPDLILGAPGQRGASGTLGAAGAVYAFAGPLLAGWSHDLASRAADLTVLGEAAGDRMGHALAVGDLDGDGKADLALGAYGADGAAGSRPNAGELRILFGPFAPGTLIDLASTPADLVIRGADPNDQLGRSVVIADVTGDGQADLVASAPLASGPGETRPASGEIYVLRGPLRPGTVDLATTAADLIIYGADASDLCGFGLGAGDVSGDGVADILVGAYQAAAGPGNSRPAAGEAYAVFGGPLAAPAVRDLAVEPADVVVLGAAAGDQLNQVDSSDLSGDGLGDLVVGADLARGPGGMRLAAGTSWILFGPFAPGTLIDLASGAGDVIVHGAAGDHLAFGQAAGDVSGDGHADLVLGAPFADGPGGRIDSGAAHVLRGPFASGTVLDLTTSAAWLTVLGAGTDDHLDHVMLGDVSGDGVDDLLVASMFDLSGADGPGDSRPDCGEAYVVLGGGDCAPAALARVAGLLGVKLPGQGVRFSWQPDAAPRHHLNAVADPKLLDPASPPPRTPHLPPRGMGEARCAVRAPESSCMDPRNDLRPLTCYQLLAACTADGAGEGPY